MENENILIIKDLDVRLFTDRGELPVIDRLSLTLKAGETLGIVGESGCVSFTTLRQYTSSCNKHKRY